MDEYGFDVFVKRPRRRTALTLRRGSAKVSLSTNARAHTHKNTHKHTDAGRCCCWGFRFRSFVQLRALLYWSDNSRARCLRRTDGKVLRMRPNCWGKCSTTPHTVSRAATVTPHGRERKINTRCVLLRSTTDNTFIFLRPRHQPFDVTHTRALLVQGACAGFFCLLCGSGDLICFCLVSLFSCDGLEGRE